MKLSLLMAIACMLSLCVPAFSLFCYNSTRMSFGLGYLTMQMVSLALPALLVGAMMLYSFHRCRYFGHLLLLLLFIIINIWIQGNLLGLTIPYDLEDYLPNANSALMRVILYCLPFPLLGIAMYLWQNAFLRSIYRILTGLIILSCIVLAIDITIYHPTSSNTHVYTFDNTRKFTFSCHENILCIVVDSMGETVFKDTLAHYPELNVLFKDFMVFERMTNPRPTVDLVSSNILFNTAHESDKLPQEITAQPLVRMFKVRGYRCEAYPPFQQLFSKSPLELDNIYSHNNHAFSRQLLFEAWKTRMIPLLVQWIFPDCVSHATAVHSIEDTELHSSSVSNMLSETSNATFIRELADSFCCSQDSLHSFKYYHLNGPDLAESASNSKTTPAEQLKKSLDCIDALVKLLKQHGLYDRTFITVTGNHSSELQPETITLFKPPHIRQDAIQFNSTDCTIAEIAPTILAELNFIAPQYSLCRKSGLSTTPLPER